MKENENGQGRSKWSDAGQMASSGETGASEEKTEDLSSGSSRNRNGPRRKWLGRSVGSTEDEQLLNRSVPAEPLPQAPELGAFTHTDSWRVLRIQGEFVQGINALAEVGAAISVFGSARFGESHPTYEKARQLGGLLAEAGFAVITGGGPSLLPTSFCSPGQSGDDNPP